MRPWRVNVEESKSDEGRRSRVTQARLPSGRLRMQDQVQGRYVPRAARGSFCGPWKANTGKSKREVAWRGRGTWARQSRPTFCNSNVRSWKLKSVTSDRGKTKCVPYRAQSPDRTMRSVKPREGCDVGDCEREQLQGIRHENMRLKAVYWVQKYCKERLGR